MPKEQTEKSRYISKYSPDKFVTGAQLIIEIVCERKAAYQNTKLPIHFWNLKEWEKFYKSQLRYCHMLLKKYSENSVLRALEDNRTKNIYSLWAPWLEPVIKEKEKEIEKEKKNREVVKVDRSEGKKARSKRYKRTKDKLELLDE